MPIDFSGQMVGRVGEAITYNPSALLKWPRPYQHLKLSKQFSLTESSTALTVEYEVRNTGEEAVELCLGTTHSLAGSKLCISTREGAAGFPLPLKAPHRMPLLEHSTSPWLYDLPSAWFGMLNNEKGGGVVGGFDSRHISFLQPDLKSGKVMLGRTRVRIEPGKVFRTGSWLMPVNRVKKIVGAARSIVADFQVTPSKADCSVSLVRKEFSSKLPTNLEVGIGLGGTKKKDNADLDVSAPGTGDFDKTELTAEEEVLAELEGEEALNRLKMQYDGSAIDVRLILESAVERAVQISFRMRRNPHGKWKNLAKGASSNKCGNSTPACLPGR